MNALRIKFSSMGIECSCGNFTTTVNGPSNKRCQKSDYHHCASSTRNTGRKKKVLIKWIISISTGISEDWLLIILKS